MLTFFSSISIVISTLKGFGEYEFSPIEVCISVKLYH